MAWLLVTLPSLVVIAVLAVLERRAGRGPGDWWINLQTFAISTLGAFTVYAWVQPWRAGSLIDGAALPPWLAVVLFVLVQDLGENLFHRMQHRIPALWAMHSLHHSDPDMNVLTTYRHFWADRLLKTVTIWTVAGMIVTPTPLAAFSYLLISQWHFVAHANLDWNLRKWSWLINTPAYHRRHHSSDPQHYDSNFAGLFPFFDVVLGAYHVPAGRPQTGLDRRPRGLADLLLWPVGPRRDAGAQPAPPAAVRTP